MSRDAVLPTGLNDVRRSYGGSEWKHGARHGLPRYFERCARGCYQLLRSVRKGADSDPNPHPDANTDTDTLPNAYAHSDSEAESHPDATE